MEHIHLGRIGEDKIMIHIQIILGLSLLTVMVAEMTYALTEFVPIRLASVGWHGDDNVFAHDIASVA